MILEPSPDLRSADASAPVAPNHYRGRAFLYVLVAAGAEDLLKVGLSHDPLERWSAFHPRWFEAFDIDHSLLVETVDRADAQALETRLHRTLTDHHCPMPITMRLAAGGRTEWYRGAYATLRRQLQAHAEAGHVVHWGARAWLTEAMRRQQEQVFEILLAAQADHHAGWLSPQRLEALRNLVDAHRCFDSNWFGTLPGDCVDDLGLHG